MSLWNLFLLHQHFPAEANLDEEDTSNLTPPPSSMEDFLVLFPANVTPRVAGVTFSVCARVSSIIVSALHSRTFSDPNGVFTSLGVDEEPKSSSTELHVLQLLHPDSGTSERYA